MPRRCHCERLLALADDPRLRAAGPAARMIFVDLMRLAHAVGSDGFLELGSGIRNLAEVAMLLAIAEPELVTHLETLVGRGMLVREAGGIACPMLRDTARKAQIARENGRKGGRPRRVAGQGEMLMGISGGKPTGTETVTQDEPPSRARLSSSSQDIKEREKDARATTDLARFGAEVVEAAGLDQARWMGTYEPVRQWRALGLADAQILDVVRTVAGRASQRITGLAYFGPAMREAAERGRPAAETRAPWADDPEYLAWRSAMTAFMASPYGPPPKCPPHIAAQMDARRAA